MSTKRSGEAPSAREFLSHSLLMTIVLSILIAALCLGRLILYPSADAGGDALYYQRYAFAFRDNGFISDFGSIRTYGYPTFLYLLSFIVGRSHQNLSIAAGLSQYALFLVFTLILSAKIGRISERWAWAVRLGLLLNPLLLSLVMDSLTEGLTIPLTILLVNCAVGADQAATRNDFFYCMLGALISAMLLMIRPANITLAIAWHFAAAAGLLRRRSWRFRANRVVGAYLAAAFILTVAVASPQVAYNNRFWGEMSAFPVCRIADLQLVLGITSLRYDSMVLNGGALAFSYVNPFFNGGNGANELSLNWYVLHPLLGLATIAGHLLASFSVNHLFTYVYDDHPPYTIGLVVIYWSVFAIGVANLISTKLDWRIGQRLIAFQAIMFLVLAVSLIVASNSILAVELRFNIIPIAVLSALAKSWHF